MMPGSDVLGQGMRLSERFVQSALDALSAHIAILDETGTIISVNRAWCRFAETNGYDSGCGVGTNYLMVCESAHGQHAGEAPQVARGIRAVMNQSLEEYTLEYPCHAPHQKRWFVVRISRFDWEGESRYIVAHQDVSELKSVQIELGASEKRLQTILDNVNNGIMTLNRLGVVESTNPAAAAIFGYADDPQAMCGLPVGKLLGEPYHGISLKSLLANVKINGEHELTGKRQDGSTFPLYFSLNKAMSGGRHIYIAIAQDITERKRMEQEMLERERLAVALEKERELSELKNRFISIMSHELRTPLASMLLSIDLLDRYGDRAPQAEKTLYIENIRAQIDNLAELVKDVSAVSRSDQLRQEFAPQKIDIVSYCRQIIKEFRLNHQSTHRIVFKSDRRASRTMLDPKLMRRVLTNLFTNAIKYSPDGGEIRVTLSHENGRIILAVADQGIGIPLEDQPRLFEPFHRANNVDHLPGTGLGLTIAKQAVELHNGNICVESAPGSGTRVSLSLPAVST